MAKVTKMEKMLKMAGFKRAADGEWRCEIDNPNFSDETITFVAILQEGRFGELDAYLIYEVWVSEDGEQYDESNIIDFTSFVMTYCED